MQTKNKRQRRLQPKAEKHEAKSSTTIGIFLPITQIFFLTKWMRTLRVVGANAYKRRQRRLTFARARPRAPIADSSTARLCAPITKVRVFICKNKYERKSKCTFYEQKKKQLLLVCGCRVRNETQKCRRRAAGVKTMSDAAALSADGECAASGNGVVPGHCNLSSRSGFSERRDRGRAPLVVVAESGDGAAARARCTTRTRGGGR